MRILIIEDEGPAAARLKKLVKELEPTSVVIDTIDSVEHAVKWFSHFEKPDLTFMDIQLADGLSFDIFRHVEVNCPVIFTTAYDQYALNAFKVNGLDYLLKPIDAEELGKSLKKFRELYGMRTDTIDYEKLIGMMERRQQERDYKERFLVKVGDQLKFIPTEEIVYFCSEEGQVMLVTRGGKRFVIDPSLDQLLPLLSPKRFFRISRKIVVSAEAIKKIHTYFNSRLKLELAPEMEGEVLVSRDRVADFKFWLDQ